MSRKFISLNFELSEAGEYLRLACTSPDTGEQSPEYVPKQELNDLVDESEDLFQSADCHLSRASDFGKKLFRTFINPFATAYQTAKELAAKHQSLLRLVFKHREDCPSQHIPWELLHDGEYLIATSAIHLLVRYIEQPRPLPQISPSNVQRMLLTAASPEGQDPLQLDDEEKRIRNALAKSSIQIDTLPQCSSDSLCQALRRAEETGNPYHIWHHCGHGDSPSASKDNDFELLLEDQGKCDPMTGQAIKDLIQDLKGLHLVALNTCWSAAAKSVVPALASINVPYVVGFRDAISDASACLFSQEFYRDLSQLSIEKAIAQTRARLMGVGDREMDWARLLLFSRHATPYQICPTPTVPPDQSTPGEPKAPFVTATNQITHLHANQVIINNQG